MLFFSWPSNFSIAFLQDYLIVNKLKNKPDIDHYNNTVNFLEDISPFRVKTRSVSFAMFFMATILTAWYLTGFSIAHFYKKYVSDRNQTLKLH